MNSVGTDDLGHGMLTLKFAEASFSRHLSKSTASVESFDLARRWLKTCDMNHERCSRRRSASELPPTRLLDLHPEGQDSGTIKLLETGQSGAFQAHYATLSHCWVCHQLR